MALQPHPVLCAAGFTYHAASLAPGLLPLFLLACRLSFPWHAAPPSHVMLRLLKLTPAFSVAASHPALVCLQLKNDVVAVHMLYLSSIALSPAGIFTCGV